MELRASGALCAAVFFYLAAPAAATQAPQPVRHEPLCGPSLRAIADATHAKVNPCVVRRGHVVIETTYYQNASRIGGTALAAYPEATIRVGIAPGVEAFMDAPSDVARSGANGLGVFYFTHPGFGLKVQLRGNNEFALGLAAEVHPPLSTLAHMSLVPIAEATLTGAWVPRRSNLFFAAQIGALRFRQRGMGGETSTAALLAVRVTAPIMRGTWLTLQLRSLSIAAVRSCAQSSGTLSLQHELSRNVLANLQVGTAFNEAGHSKAHYLGFGFTFQP